MKILQIHNQYFFKGGEDTVVDNEKKILIKNKHKVIQLIRKNNLEIKSFIQKIKIGFNVIYSNQSKKIIFQKLQEIKPDVVHIHNIFPLWTYSVVDVCNDLKIPVILTIHNYRLICAKGTFYRNNNICEKCFKGSLYNSIINSCYQNSLIKTIPVALMIKKYNKGLYLINKIHKFIVLTSFAKKKLLEANFPKNKIIIKPNFINKIQVTNGLKKKSSFLYASRLSEEKGLLDLIYAHKKFQFDLTICGDGPLRDVLSSNKQIKYLGFLNKKKLYKKLNETKFLLFPSKWYEGFPMIILEAFAHNVLVIASNLGSVSSIIKHKYNGLLFEPSNTEDLIKQIKWALSNEKKCNEIRVKAKKILDKKYGEKNNYKKLLSIYENSIKKNKNNKLFN